MSHYLPFFMGSPYSYHRHSSSGFGSSGSGFGGFGGFGGGMSGGEEPEALVNLN